MVDGSQQDQLHIHYLVLQAAQAGVMWIIFSMVTLVCSILIGCLHDPANFQQTSSITFAGSLLDRVNTP